MILNKNSTIAITTSNASVTTALPVGGGELLWLYNDSVTAAEHVFLEVGDSTVTVQAPTANVGGGFHLPPAILGNGIFELRLKPTDTHIAMVSGSGTPVVFITRGRAM